MRTPIYPIFFGLALISPAAAAPSLRVSGGITLNGVSQPLLFTWRSTISVSGGGWAPGEIVDLVLRGPLDLPRVPPRLAAHMAVRRTPPGSGRNYASVPLGTFMADAQGNLSAAPAISYDSGIVGFSARIPRPGYYEVRAIGRVSGIVVAAGRINLCPDTYTGTGGAPFDWGHERGGRDGILPGPLRQFSPERFDPEWPAAWDERPVELYGTVAPLAGASAIPGALISPSDNPPTHYAHDANFYVSPDPGYEWLTGTANTYSGDAAGPGLGRVEVEWETLNGGSTATYGQGKIGLPLWASATVGDRVYVVGRWILDAGHPEVGDRTEIHPPRLIATMRQRPAVLNGSAATQVDIYVSGHGGGANSMPPGLSALLDDDGHGGGRIRDVLSPADQDIYYRAGPLASVLYPLASTLIQQLTGFSLTSTIYPTAGPSAFPWGAPGVEERPVNDRDYDFDVPLPPTPPGATSVAMQAVTHPGHTTAVSEVVTYTGVTAHIHLPYRGADNGIYARTLEFAWNRPPAPASHWVVRLNSITVNDSPGKWQLWSDVSGQWSYLSGAAPQLLNTSAGGSVALPGTPQDVYLNAGQTIRVQVQGYRAACLDDFFGKLFGESSYVAGLGFVANCGAADNQDLGYAVLEIPQQPSPQGSYTVQAADSAGNHHFSVAIAVEAP